VKNISRRTETINKTSHSTAFLQKLTVPQQVKKFLAFYKNRTFIIAFTIPSNLSLSWARLIHSTPSHLISLRSIIIYYPSSTLRSSKWSLSLRFAHQKPIRIFLHFHTCYMPRPSQSPWFDYPNIIWWGVQIMKILIMQFATVPCYLVPLNPKYLPQHPVLRHPQHILFPQCERTRFTAIQNNRQNVIQL
jgi:hypothetical protein